MKNLLGEVSSILYNDVRQLPDNHLYDLLLFGSSVYNEIAYKMFLEATVSLIIHAKVIRIIEKLVSWP